jgi:hypothetical protein
MQYTIQGIQLAQQGRKTEALAYLREAVQREPINAEVWLWLAHVTPDRLEYQNCVMQALRLEPNHPIGRQMQDALLQTQYTPAYPTSGVYPAYGGQPQSPYPAQSTVPYAPHQPLAMDQNLLYRVQNQQGQRSFWRRLFGVALAGILLGVLVALIVIFVVGV